jgi:hypothetical protein
MHVTSELATYRLCQSAPDADTFFPRAPGNSRCNIVWVGQARARYTRNFRQSSPEYLKCSKCVMVLEMRVFRCVARANVQRWRV